MFRFGLLTMTLLAGALMSGCAADCTSANDCAPEEVCYQEVCTPATASWVSCGGDDDCNGENGSGYFECRAGRCQLVRQTVGPDSGVPDTGTSTITDAGN